MGALEEEASEEASSLVAAHMDTLDMVQHTDIEGNNDSKDTDMGLVGAQNKECKACSSVCLAVR